MVDLVKDSSISWVGVCSVEPQNEYYVDGSISFADTAFYKMTPVDDIVDKSNVDSMLFAIKMKNSFPAGLPYGATNDTGIIVNIALDSTLSFDRIISEPGEIDFDYREVSDRLTLWQQYNAALDNYAAPVDSFLEMATVELQWNYSGYTPSWNDRFVCPEFVHDSSDIGTAVALDTAGCLRADSLNGRLVFWDQGEFDAVECAEIAMGEFSTNVVSSSSPCVSQELYIRTNVATIDTFFVEVNLSSPYGSIHGVRQVMSGVTATRVNSKKYRFTTNGSFGSLSTDTQVRIAILDYEVGGGCSNGTAYNLGVDVQNPYLAYNGEVPFIAESVGSASATCNLALQCIFFEEPDLRDVDPPDTPDNLPIAFALDQNYPNPFNPVTTINLSLPVASDWQITIYNVTGQVVKEFAGHSGPGVVSVEWNADRYSSGVYLYRAVAGRHTATRKMLLLK
ncbi:T9SS type A sorting domain-containing protein [candidate division GN15 bacterium]|nr:T9SS type A sorting domain-containing protein [candidate division GN15 bacterium]